MAAWTVDGYATCPYTVAAVKLLREHKLPFSAKMHSRGAPAVERLKKRWGHPTVPIVVRDGILVGGFTELDSKVAAAAAAVAARKRGSARRT